MRNPTPDEPWPAGLGRRLGAMLYDSLLLVALLMAVTLAVIGLQLLAQGGHSVRDSGQAAVGGLALRLPLLATIVLFFGWFWTRWGCTLGMQAWRLRIERLDGTRIGWGQALARLALACLSWCFLGAGYWSALFDRERRTWHDRWTGSRIVQLPARTTPAPRAPV